MNPKNYIIGERLSYLAMGSIVGYFIAKNIGQFDIYFIGAVVLFAIGLSYYFRRKK